MNELIRVVNLHKTFSEATLQTPVLRGIHLQIFESETVAILGASGSGKSTLLHTLGGLQSFDQGEINFREHAYSRLNQEQMTKMRERQFGFVYQFHHLILELSALENVMLPLMIRKIAKNVATEQAEILLTAVGLSHRAHHKPFELSGGERQRVALARALVKKPTVLFADEPTGNLDRQASEKVMDLMFTMSAEFKINLIYITHDESLAARADRILRMEDGHLKE